MRKPAGIFVLLVGLLLLVVVVRAYFEFMQLAASSTGIDLSLSTRAMLVFVPDVDLAAGSALAPADLAAMINRIIFGCGGLGFILLLCGGYLLLMGDKPDGENTVT